MTKAEKREYLDGEVYGLKLSGYKEDDRDGSKTYYSRSFFGSVYVVDSKAGTVRQDIETQCARLTLTVILVCGLVSFYWAANY